MAIFSNSTSNNIFSKNFDLVLCVLLISIISIIFNIVVCSLISNSARLRQPFHLLIANLALADILYGCSSILRCIMIIFTADYNYSLDIRQLLRKNVKILCGITNFIAAVAMSNSMMTLAAIGIERYRGIIHPLTGPIHRNKMNFIIIAIWFYALVCATIFIFVTDYDRRDLIDCSGLLSQTHLDTSLVLSAFFAVLNSLLPLLIIFICYTCIIIKLRNINIPIEDSRYKLHALKTIKKRNLSIISILLITTLSACGTIPYAFSYVWISFQKTLDPNFTHKLLSKFSMLFRVTTVMMFMPDPDYGHLIRYERLGNNYRNKISTLEFNDNELNT
ncbi:uncharacterized protein TRIADDRAFT_61729 [Trichoplax adhaerens]|uniref:G-protein coupled receptors family 1 profile domain-containing protein n=1 Tax=Trichoplax adhaerens TaxID=10228 RepID=B3SBT5_TRIAD|nr:predicted protein [Trichoplax adhaerens]EDV19847.1 predicted protein [Trichoplax adhaerens]|eukprot:XP_002117717.1 predicted protein [Trichoplax adhaerens]